MSDQKRRTHLNKSRPLPSIPEKLYFTIGEVADLCGLKPHVLRYWEQEFDQLNPAKRRGNRRYYQRPDVLTARRIRGLLYESGYTIEGARQTLAQQENTVLQPKSSPAGEEAIVQAIEDLQNLLNELESALLV